MCLAVLLLLSVKLQLALNPKAIYPHLQAVRVTV